MKCDVYFYILVNTIVLFVISNVSGFNTKDKDKFHLSRWFETGKYEYLGYFVTFIQTFTTSILLHSQSSRLTKLCA